MPSSSRTTSTGAASPVTSTVPEVSGQLRLTVHCRNDDKVARTSTRTMAMMPMTQGQRRRFTGAGAVVGDVTSPG